MGLGSSRVAAPERSAEQTRWQKTQSCAIGCLNSRKVQVGAQALPFIAAIAVIALSVLALTGVMGTKVASIGSATLAGVSIIALVKHAYDHHKAMLKGRVIDAD